MCFDLKGSKVRVFEFVPMEVLPELVFGGEGAMD